MRAFLRWLQRWISGDFTRQEILRLLREHGPSYGPDIVKRSEARQGRVRRGSVYVHLHKMEDLGWVVSREAELAPDGQSKRRVYSIAPAGYLALWPPGNT